ncbi:uncharacterized protein LOC116189015 isoform X1 [Punica granatum]|uniref:Uncharacterized protein LOC116189015 isoform X1 n=2 Tax=Punica granatum TaxID=22663 RepID=A0A6P8BYV1_PUNGR|nr:uncharacterized protein LOC116189015 isoform X1 [Punica granatum]XP_031374366.1 uncharacterized protein LOC116189015 isoform X1 [Punica granatum]
MMGDGYYGVSSAPGIIFTAGNSTPVVNNPGLAQARSSSGSLLDSEPGLKHDTGLAVEWSITEQYKLEEGLIKYADEPSIMRYIKIAATLQDKTVRDVALRCRWMTRKRPGKKVNIRKLAESSSKSSAALPVNMAAYAPVIHHMNQNDMIPFEVSGTSGSANPRNLLEQNTQAFSRIRANLHLLKLQDNIDLFCCARNNIAAILNNMRNVPGIMSQMPPLPVSIDEDLANAILPYAARPMGFGSGGGIPLKQEPRC